jgi:tetratricopeptide (TPR) repeat protein
MNPNFAQGYALRGVVRRAVGDLSGAIEDFESALRLERRHFEARVALGEIYLDLRDKKRALAMFESALVWNPHDAVAGAHVRRLRFELQGEET